MANIIGSTDFMTKTYVDYQQKYRNDPRESDKSLIQLVRDHVVPSEEKTLLDIGCHNGNLLYQIRKQILGLTLAGGDLFGEVIEHCKAVPDLEGISYEVMDILDLNCDPVDFIVVNAVLFRFDDEQHRLAWKNLSHALKLGGWAFVFDYYHAFHQTLRIIEETPEHQEGLILNLRSQTAVSRTVHSAGFNSPTFFPFQIDIDLHFTDPTSAHLTYTQTLVKGFRLLFRGALYQP